MNQINRLIQEKKSIHFKLKTLTTVTSNGSVCTLQPFVVCLGYVYFFMQNYLNNTVNKANDNMTFK